MIKKIYVHAIETEKQKWNDLLNKEGIKSEDNIDETFGLYDNDALVATASRYQNVIKCVAVNSDYQGGEYFNKIISHVINRNTELGYFKHYVYTKPESKKAFGFLGFKEIEEVDGKLVFMENAMMGFDMFLDNLKKHRVDKENVSAIVMNANPFTLGHQYLIEHAAKQSDHLFVFVLSEEMSVFTSAVRIKLVKEGSKHLDNVTVLPTENYMVSNATFPSYFLKESDDTTKIQARLDARIFANHIAKAANITKRFVGDEPFSKSTSIYNEALKQEFEGKLQLQVIERIGNDDDDIISATKVRNFLIEDDFETVKNYVPKTTYDFLVSEEGKAVIERLKESQHEHP